MLCCNNYIINNLFPTFALLYSDYTNVEMLHNGSRIEFSASCATLLHTIQNVSLSDQGVYFCRAQAVNGSTIEKPLGNLTVFSKLLCHSYVTFAYM